MTSTGRGIRNVIIRLTDAGGSVRLATTTAFGYYRFTNVAAGETYIITAKGKRYEFSQTSQVLNVNEDAADVNFIANPSGRKLEEF
jgi:phage gp45-like